MVEHMLFILLVLFNSESVLCVLQLSCIFVPKIYLRTIYESAYGTDFVFGFRMAGIIKTRTSVSVSVPVRYRTVPVTNEKSLRDYFTENFYSKI